MTRSPRAAGAFATTAGRTRTAPGRTGSTRPRTESQAPPRAHPPPPPRPQAPARRAPQAGASRAPRAHRQGDPEPAHLRGPHRGRGRRGRRGGAELPQEVSEPLRILQLYPKGDYFTGPASPLLALARGLRNRGHHVVVATRPGEGWVEKCAEAGLPYHAVPMRSEADVTSVPALVRILRQHRI